MLSDVFPQLLPDNQMVHSPLIWENTHFCMVMNMLQILATQVDELSHRVDEL